MKLLWTLFLLSSAMASPLQSLLERYYAHSPSLKAESFRVEAVREQARSVLSYPAPEVGFEWGSRAVSPGMSNETMFYGGLTLGQEFMFPGKRKAMEQAESERTHMAQADYKASTLDGGVRIAQVYLDLYMIQERKKLIDTTLTILRDLQESARRRFETGMSGMEEGFRIQAETSRLRSDSISLCGENQGMRIMLASAMGDTAEIPITTQISFADSQPQLPAIDSLMILALHKPELQSMSSAKRMALKESEVARLRKMPDLMLQGRYMTMMGPDEWALMVGVKVPIAPWASTESKALEASAKYREQEALAREQAMNQMIRSELHNTYARYISALSRLHLIQVEQLASAQNALQSARIAYSNGKSDLSMAIDANRMVLMAHEEFLMAKLSVLNSLLLLEKATGTPAGTWLPETSK